MPKDSWRAALFFDATGIAAMHKAFEATCERLQIEDASSREVVVERIVDLVRRGEYDPDTIAAQVVEQSGVLLSPRRTGSS